jgi:hypothetical protein
MQARSAPRSCIRTVALFALTGFLAGFLGPLVFDPHSNLGPIIGLLFSGPAGAALGLVACGLERLLPRVFTPTVLRGLAGVLALATLYYCLPEPRAVGSVIDAKVLDCISPSTLYPQSLKRWEAALAGAPRARPLPDWRQEAWRNAEDFDAVAVAVTVRVERRRIIYARRRPWDHGQRFAGPWLQGPPEERTYFAPVSSGDCHDWRQRGRALYSPVREGADRPIRPAAVWPPVDAPGFLMLQELGPVPTRIRTLLR